MESEDAVPDAVPDASKEKNKIRRDRRNLATHGEAGKPLAMTLEEINKKRRDKNSIQTQARQAAQAAKPVDASQAAESQAAEPADDVDASQAAEAAKAEAIRLKKNENQRKRRSIEKNLEKNLLEFALNVDADIPPDEDSEAAEAANSLDDSQAAEEFAQNVFATDIYPDA